ncbi:MAG: ATP-binding protein [Candidatus Diapherotrites archaeon]|nr:ATP-binding protein [Candidatus Diapherotrites archaeon]
MTMIEELMVAFNPWWKNAFSFEFRPRTIYPQIRRFHGLPQIVALTGLRRVGKSTLLFKVVQDEIAAGTDPKSVLYFSFDEFQETEPSEILKAHYRLTGIDVAKEKTLLLFDEVQKLGDWENKLKTVYDLYKGKAKIYISGSESLFVRTKSKETLAGRIFYFKIDTLSFIEYLDFKRQKREPVALYQKELALEFAQYIQSQGFPELVGINDRTIIQKYLQEGIVEKIVYKEIPAIFPVKETAVLESLLKLLMEEPGQIMDMQTIASSFRTTRQTISNYLTFLERAFLVRKLYNYSPNKRKAERKLKKYYPTILSPALTFKEDAHAQSKVLECVVVNRLNSEFFWRDPYKNEVDIILTEPDLLPIEVKRAETKSKGLERFMQKYKTKKGYILTHDQEKESINQIRVIPAFKYFAGQR